MFSIFYPQQGFEWHQEDAWAGSKKYPIFAVADGVTLPATMYPDSGARTIAQIFCREAVKFLEQDFGNISETKITEAYLHANKFVEVYNQQRKESFNYATVAALAVVEGGRVFGSRVTDCGLALVRDGKLVFKTPEFWSEMKRAKREGYGLINGQPDLERYIDFYVLDYFVRDWLILFSDGFENHFTNNEFVSLFSGNDIEKIKRAIDVADSHLIEIDDNKFGHERTLLVVSLV